MTSLDDAFIKSILCSELPLVCTHSGRDNLHFLLDGEITCATVYNHFPLSAHPELQTMIQVLQDPVQLTRISCLLSIYFTDMICLLTVKLLSDFTVSMITFS